MPVSLAQSRKAYQGIMADVCSLSKKGFLDCGSSRGRSETLFLNECRDDLTAHLKYCSLSRADLKEYEVILQRAGLEHLSHEQVKKLRVCPRHRYGLGKYWRPSKVVSVPRTQRNTHQRQKSRRDQS